MEKRKWAHPHENLHTTIGATMEGRSYLVVGDQIEFESHSK